MGVPSGTNTKGVRCDTPVSDVLSDIQNTDVYIRVEAASARGEKGLTGKELVRNWTEPEERRDAKPEERRDTKLEDVEDDSEKQLDKDLNTETLTTTNKRHGRTHHVPGGAWLSQMSSFI
ncbi:hypothetical protein NDU88_001567 [Pleurodeles waltl]|uniref:Uncharacterized protein n=1 Tax=Pleurodeles waltl TaxID=8319 RepID=A0AAV7LA40_PLEWA|nr:hypothetical protein NDU88_001567 [Pleurodeles waltl]